jgi:hypothetical protein
MLKAVQDLSQTTQGSAGRRVLTPGRLAQQQWSVTMGRKAGCDESLVFFHGKLI